jgi:hypothetical protein
VVESASKDTAEFTTWEAKPWFDVLRQIPDDGSRLSLLNRTWDWFGLVPFPYKNPLLVTWAEQMASLGHASRALDVVREIPTAEDRALAFFKISLAVGLLRGEPRAAEIFSWIPQTVDEAVQQNDSCFRVLAEASEAFARAGDMDRFHGIHALGRRVLTSMARHFQTGSVLSGLLSSLVVANLAEPWLDLVAFTASHAGIDSDMFRYFLEDLEKMNFAQSMCFTTTQRSAALRHLLAFSKRMKMRPSYEAKIFQLCASGCTDLLPLKETFREASSCHPDLISALLGNPWEKAREDRPTPALTTCDLPWLASLCPYSAEATVSIIGHAVADALAREDWSGIHRITLECGPVPLKELQRLAEAVLASRAA